MCLFFLLQKIWGWLPYFVTKPPAANYRSVLCVSTWAFLSFQGIIDDRAAIFGERFYLLKSHLPSLKRYIDVK